MDHNKYVGVGRLARDPEYFPPGMRGEEHCTFTLAINRVVPREDGAVADFIPCSLWGPVARQFVEARAKGDEVGVIGRLRTNLVQKGDGSRQSLMEIRVEEVRMGRKSLTNLRPLPVQDRATQVVARLNSEFRGNAHQD